MQICASEKPKVKLEKVLKRWKNSERLMDQIKQEFFFWTKATKISLENLVM